MCIGEECCGRDSDEVFAYSTPAVVRIKDRKLGLLYHTFRLLAFIWVVIWNVFAQKGWAKVTIPRGSVRMSPMQPKINDKGIKGCSGGANCFDDFTSFEKLPYCQQSPLDYIVDNTRMKKLPCRAFDATGATLISPGHIQFMTRYLRESQYHSCNTSLASNACPGRDLWQKNESNVYPKTYAVDLEEFTVLLQHSIDTSSLSSTHLKGVLKSKNIALCIELDLPVQESVRGEDRFYCDIQPGDTYSCVYEGNKDDCGYDIFDLGTLLKAGEANKDKSRVPTMSPLDKPILAGSKTPQRYTGMTVSLDVYYTNNANGSLFVTPWAYEYVVSIIDGSKTEWTEVTVDKSGDTRDKYTYRGVNMMASIGGEYLRFDPSTLLIQLTSALALLSVASLIVEITMSKCLRLRGVYTSMKVKETPDFSILNQQLDRMSKATAAKLTYRDIKDMLEEIDSDYKRRRTSSVEEVQQAKAKAMRQYKSSSGEYKPPNPNGPVRRKNRNSWKHEAGSAEIAVKIEDRGQGRVSDVEMTNKVLDES